MAIPLTTSNGILKSVAQLVVNSLTDGQQYDNLTNFTVFLDYSTGIRGAKHVEISNITFSNYVKQFHSLKKNVAFLYNGSPSFIEIDTTKYYDVSGLIVELNNKFSAGTFTITTSYDTSTKKLIFTETGGNTIQILGGFQDGYPINNRCNSKLGYYIAGSAFSSSAEEAIIPLRLNAECIYIGSSLSSDSVSPSQPTVKNILLKIPLYSYNVGDIISFIPSSDLIYDLKSSSIETIRFNIYDEELLLTEDLMNSPVYVEFHFSD